MVSENPIACDENQLSNEIYGKNVFPQDLRGYFRMEKVKFPENTLFYVNKPRLIVQERENILYADYFLVGQEIAAPNTPADVDTYVFPADEVKVIRPLYDVETGDYKGLKNTVGLICIRGDQDEVLFNYGFDEKKSKVLYCTQKRRFPNASAGTVFNKHNNKLLIEKRENCLLPPMEKRK